MLSLKLLLIWWFIIERSAAQSIANPLTGCSSSNTGSSNKETFNPMNSYGACTQFCSGYAYAIMQGKMCWCSNETPADTVSVSQCSESCPGYPNDRCGSTEDGLFGYAQLGNPSSTQQASSTQSPTTSTTMGITSQKSTSSQSTTQETTSSTMSSSTIPTSSTTSMTTSSTSTSTSSSTTASVIAITSSVQSSPGIITSSTVVSTSSDISQVISSTWSSSKIPSSTFSSSASVASHTTSSASSLLTPSSVTASSRSASNSASGVTRSSTAVTSSAAFSSSSPVVGSSSVESSSRGSRSPANSITPTTSRIQPSSPTTRSAAPSASSTYVSPRGNNLSGDNHKSFWHRGGAVAGTFVAVGIVVVLLIALAIFFCCRRRHARPNNGTVSLVQNEAASPFVGPTEFNMGPSSRGHIFAPVAYSSAGSQHLRKPSTVSGFSDSTMNLVPIFDQRVDPNQMYMHMGQGGSETSLQDNEDYSRRVLRIANPGN